MVLIDRDPTRLVRGDFYEDVFYHPCLFVEISDECATGISLIDGSYPRAADLYASGTIRLTLAEAVLWKWLGPTAIAGLSDRGKPVPGLVPTAYDNQLHPLKPGGFFGSRAYHPCLFIGVGNDGGSGISLVDGSYVDVADALMGLTFDDAITWKKLGPKAVERICLEPKPGGAPAG